MENLDFEKSLHFEEFPPVSTEEWESVIERDLKGKNYKEELRWHSGEGLEPLPFYRREHLSQLEHDPAPLQDKTGWHILELVERADIKSANQQALLALENGASGIHFNPARNFISSKAELESLFKNIRIELIAVKFGSALSTPQIAGWLNEIVSDQNLKIKDLNLTFEFAPYSQSLLTGQLSPVHTIKEIAEKFNVPFRFCGVNTGVYANAGASIVQQLAFALASANEYLGSNTNLAKHLHFNFSFGSHYFLEIAKIRAFKLMWKQVLNEYDLQDAPPFISGETAYWNKTTTDAHNNMLRSTTEAMSAALSGCSMITVHPYDEHFAEPSAFASRMARNIQLILQEEAHLDKVSDPGAGSYYIEVLTDSLAKKSWELFQQIESKGGFHSCLQSGFIQELINNSRNRRIEAYRASHKVLVGVNKYEPSENDTDARDRTSIPDHSLPVLDKNDEIEVLKTEPLNIESELQKRAE